MLNGPVDSNNIYIYTGLGFPPSTGKSQILETTLWKSKSFFGRLKLATWMVPWSLFFHGRLVPLPHIRFQAWIQCRWKQKTISAMVGVQGNFLGVHVLVQICVTAVTCESRLVNEKRVTTWLITNQIKLIQEGSQNFKKAIKESGPLLHCGNLLQVVVANPDSHCFSSFHTVHCRRSTSSSLSPQSKNYSQLHYKLPANIQCNIRSLLH